MLLSCNDNNLWIQINSQQLIHHGVDLVPYTLHMDGCLVVRASARLGSLPVTFRGSATMSPCFPCSLSISALHYTPFRAGVCIVTDNHVQEFEARIKHFRGIFTFISRCWFHFGSWKKKRKIIKELTSEECAGNLFGDTISHRLFVPILDYFQLYPHGVPWSKYFFNFILCFGYITETGSTLLPDSQPVYWQNTDHTALLHCAFVCLHMLVLFLCLFVCVT